MCRRMFQKTNKDFTKALVFHTNKIPLIYFYDFVSFYSFLNNAAEGSLPLGIFLSLFNAKF